MPEPEKLILMLDILGFEDFFLRHGLDYTTRLYKQLSDYVDSQDGGLSIIPVPNGDGTVSPAVGWLVTEHCRFSDTILIWSHYDQLRLWDFSDMCSELICQSLELGFAVRGAITVGEAMLDNQSSTYLGSPLIEAARVEKAQKWIGASFGPSFNRNPYNSNLPLKNVLAYRQHTKEGYESFVPGLVLDWPRKWRETRNRDLSAVLKALPRNESHELYYRITNEFIDFSFINHDWFFTEKKLSFHESNEYPR